MISKNHNNIIIIYALTDIYLNFRNNIIMIEIFIIIVTSM